MPGGRFPDRVSSDRTHKNANCRQDRSKGCPAALSAGRILSYLCAFSVMSVTDVVLNVTWVCAYRVRTLLSLVEAVALTTVRNPPAYSFYGYRMEIGSCSNARPVGLTRARICLSFGPVTLPRDTPRNSSGTNSKNSSWSDLRTIRHPRQVWLSDRTM